MARVTTPNLSLGTFADGENPGAGSQSIRSTGLNDLPIALDTAVGAEHNADGTHKAAVIDKGNLKTTVADGSSIELHATNGLQVKAAGITAAMHAANSIAAGGTAVQAKAIKAADLADGCIDVGGLKIAAGALKAADFGAASVETAAIKDANVTTAKLEYKEYVAILNQAGSGAPVATVIINTLSSTPVWTRDSTGIYFCTLTGAFTANKTAVFITGGSMGGFLFALRADSNIVQVNTLTVSASASDNILGLTTIMIRVYP